MECVHAAQRVDKYSMSIRSSEAFRNSCFSKKIRQIKICVFTELTLRVSGTFRLLLCAFVIADGCVETSELYTCVSVVLVCKCREY